MHCAEGVEFLRARRAGREMRLHIARVAGIELAVHKRVKHDFRLGAIHGGDPSAAFHAERSIDRARASRDITVPTGTPATSAISW